MLLNHRHLEFEKNFYRSIKLNKDISEEEIASLYIKTLINLVENFSPVNFESHLNEMPAALKEIRTEMEDFEERLLNTWSTAFDCLEMIVSISEEVSIAFFEEGNSEDEFLEKIDFLLKIHSNSILIAKEITVLLKSGFVDGAMARWRSLHEANVVFHILASTFQKDLKLFSEIKRRFLDYSIVDEYKRFVPNKSIEEEIRIKKSMKKNFNMITEKYGANFSKQHGWAYPLFPKNKEKEFISFRELEKLADYENIQPYYKEANHHVHISSLGINESLSFMPFYDNSTSYLYGPSNYGLSKPGQLTSNTLVQITTKLLLLKPNIDKFLFAKLLLNFAEKGNENFNEIQRTIKEEELNREE